MDKASALAKAQGIKYIGELCEGRAAAQHRCDLIIIGSRGLNGVRRVTLGETGHEVVLNAPMPVVVVKESRLRSVGREHCTAMAG